MAVEVVTSLVGQSMVGRSISTPWASGVYEINQGWGAVELELAPAGHGYAHWHAGADLGMACGTELHLPAGIGSIGGRGGGRAAAVAEWVDNPGGYGTALKIRIQESKVDIWLGHLAVRLVPDGQVLRPGDRLALTNNSGNSTGCHLHFEVRPYGGRYGTDIDPTVWILDPGGVKGIAEQPPADPFGIAGVSSSINQATSSALAQALAMGQIGLGGSMMAGGLIVASYGLRDRTMAQLRGDVRQSWRRAGRRAEQGRRAKTAEGDAAFKAEQAATRGMTAEEIERYRAGERFIPDAASRRSGNRRTIVDPNDPRQVRKAQLAELAAKRARGPQIDVEGGLERVRAARLSRVRKSHQKAAAVLRDERGVPIPF